MAGGDAPGWIGGAKGDLASFQRLCVLARAAGYRELTMALAQLLA